MRSIEKNNRWVPAQAGTPANIPVPVIPKWSDINKAAGDVPIEGQIRRRNMAAIIDPEMDD